MDKNRKLILALIAVILLLVGGIGGYVTRQFYSTAGTPAADTSKMPNLNDKTGGSDSALSPARDTAIVKAVKKVGPAVVGITTKVYNRDIFNQQVLVGEGVGSGVVFDKAGYIVTNNHVVQGAGDNKVSVSLADGKTVEGTVVGRDPVTDLAVVKIEPTTDMAVAEFGDSDSLQVGEPAIAIGNPLGLEFQGSVTAGVISALHRTLNVEEQRIPLIQTDAAINPGNSGGALVDADGYVIGINSEKIAQTGVEGMGFAIPINQAKPILEELIKNGKVDRPYLGMWVLDKEMAARYGYALNADGLYVARLADGGPAQVAGIQRGDLITAINDTKLTTLTELRKALDNFKPGNQVTLTLSRGGASQTVQVTLGTVSSTDSTAAQR